MDRSCFRSSSTLAHKNFVQREMSDNIGPGYLHQCNQANSVNVASAAQDNYMWVVEQTYMCCCCGVHAHGFVANPQTDTHYLCPGVA